MEVEIMNTTKLNNENEVITAEKLTNLLLARLNERKDRGAWAKGVTTYAFEMVEGIQWDIVHYHNVDLADLLVPHLLDRVLLNGAESWSQYSWGGCSPCYDSDICKRLCSPSEIKKRRGGDWRPNRYEEWLDVQARALYQAARRIKNTVSDIKRDYDIVI